MAASVSSLILKSLLLMVKESPPNLVGSGGLSGELMGLAVQTAHIILLVRRRFD
jgi:hypothetical protein